MTLLEKYREKFKEGKIEGEVEHLAGQVCRKLRKGKTAAQIADELEEDEARIKAICDAASEFAPDYDETKVAEKLATTSVS